MRIEEIHGALRARPFQRFTIRCASGQEIDVPHPEFVAISRAGRAISAALPAGGFAIVDLLLIESLDFGDERPAMGGNGA
jgi:hypothetical protein